MGQIVVLNRRMSSNQFGVGPIVLSGAKRVAVQVGKFFRRVRNLIGELIRKWNEASVRAWEMERIHSEQRARIREYDPWFDYRPFL